MKLEQLEKKLEDWLTAAEAARELGISRQAMQQRLRDRKHRAIHTHYGYLVDPASIEQERKAKAKV